jgi:hypothetical protein
VVTAIVPVGPASVHLLPAGRGGREAVEVFPMGADSTLVSYGVRYTIPEEEHGPLESRSDPRQQAARRCQLDSGWGRFASESGEEVYYLFVGAKLGSIGYEGQAEICRSRDDLTATMDGVGEKLKRAGIMQEPGFYVQFCPDY